MALLTACGSGDRAEILVAAASSLTDAFAGIEEAYEADNPGVDVVLSLSGSAGLREQILEGSPFDVFAPADEINMGIVRDAGLVAGQPALFALNTLQIAVPSSNPGSVTGLSDFSRAELLVGLCAEGVPCGDFAREVLTMAGVVARVDTNEPDVRSLLAKIADGELDVGITFVTDVFSASGRVDGIDIPDTLNVVAGYPIAVLDSSRDRVVAQDFVGFVLGPIGQDILARHGFVSP